MSHIEKCFKCGSPEINAEVVDYRTMFQCGNCALIWYSKRIATDPYTIVVDSITSEVERHGYCLMELDKLAKGAFKNQPGLPPTADQILLWARQNKLIVDIENGIIYFLR
jgi:hypothetical protein